MGVVGQRHHDIGACAQELPMQLDDRIGKIKHCFWHISARLDVTPAFQLEYVPLGSQHRAVSKALGQSRTRPCHNPPSLAALTTLPQTGRL